MFELELSVSFLLLGIVLDRWLWPKLIWPRLRAWIARTWFKQQAKKLMETAKRVEKESNQRSFNVWPEHKPCPSCGSKTRHRADCPENPKNKVKA
jgi:hypothetical protein